MRIEIERLEFKAELRERRSEMVGDLLRFYRHYPVHIDAYTLAGSVGGSTGRTLE